jgi:hypothetical protein
VTRFAFMFAAAGLLGTLSAEVASACSGLSPLGELKRRKAEQKYIKKNSDKQVVGTFFADPKGRQESDEYRLKGVIEVKRRGQVDRYRVSIPGVINCGFPYYFVQSGDHGRFYLKRDIYPDTDDLDDDYIDNFDYVHFQTKGRSED